MNPLNLNLPGISDEYLQRANVQNVDAQVAYSMCGLSRPGMTFPYFNMWGERVEDGGVEYVRLRLAEPDGDKKYHQRAGTSVHAYLPPSIWKDGEIDYPIYIIEGEKKALALAEAGFTAIGISGFYGFGNQLALASELDDVLQVVGKSKLIIFVGDQDVIFNAQFADAAVKLKRLLPNAILMARCIPRNAPGKGADDCRGALGEGFREWWLKDLVSAMVYEHTTAGTLALALLEPQLQDLPTSCEEAVLQGIARLAAGLRSHPLEYDHLIEVAVNCSGKGRSVVKRLFKQVPHERAADLSRKGFDEFGAESIDLALPASLWAARVLQNISQHTFVYGGNLCTHVDGRFEAHTPASLVSFCDDPTKNRFVSIGPDGVVKQRQFAEKDARILIGAVRQNLEVLRRVEVVSNVPVLAFSGDQARVIQGYDKELRILAGYGNTELPTPEEAAKRMMDILQDFDFPSERDAGRALAFLLTPALASGRFLDSGRSPFFMIAKDQCGAGAGTLVRLMTTIYGLKPASITPNDPKAAKEDISKLLLGGANFIYFDNIRTGILSKLDFLESLLTEPMFTCRAPYVHGEIGVASCVFACTSNGTHLSRDLASRTVKITIRKKPDGYPFHLWSGSTLLDHVEADRFHYLGAVYSLISAWAKEGRPSGKNLSGFRFPQWEAACAWMLQRFFPELPLLGAGHSIEQQEMADPEFDLLRSVLRESMARGHHTVMAKGLANLAFEAGLMDANDEGAAMHMGRILKRLFSSEGQFPFAGELLVTRRAIKARDTNYESVTQYDLQPLNNGPRYQKPNMPDSIAASQPAPI